LAPTNAVVHRELGNVAYALDEHQNAVHHHNPRPQAQSPFGGELHEARIRSVIAGVETARSVRFSGGHATQQDVARADRSRIGLNPSEASGSASRHGPHNPLGSAEESAQPIGKIARSGLSDGGVSLA
jgi:hypothetical protein